MTKSITPTLPVALLRDLPVMEQPRALTRYLPGRSSAPTQSSTSTASPEPVPFETDSPALPGPPTLHPNAPKAQPAPATLPAYEQGYRAGFEAARAEGFEQGHREGLEKALVDGRELGRKEVLDQSKNAQAQLDRRADRLGHLISSLEAQIQERSLARLAGAEDDMVALCHTVICRILGDRLITREGVAQGVRQAVQQCIGSGSHAPYSGLVAIHINPRDLEALKTEAGLGEWFRQHGVQDIPWVADEQVQLGGCIVRTTQGSLDARLETQLAALQELLLGDERTPSSMRPPANPYAEAE